MESEKITLSYFCHVLFELLCSEKCVYNLVSFIPCTMVVKDMNGIPSMYSALLSDEVFFSLPVIAGQTQMTLSHVKIFSV